MKKQGKKIIVLFIVLLSYNLLFMSKAQLPVESKHNKQKRMEWWRDARFGMFIHWGIYALPARHEWVKSKERMSNQEYQKYFDHFYPDLYNPREWAKKAKDAGMKYMVITTKHHDGFCLWDTKHTDYNVMYTAWGKDLIKPMVEAFRAEGIRVGFYYSLIDWHHPEYTTDHKHPLRDDKEYAALDKKRDMNKYAQYIRNQITELLTNYGQIDLLFLDFSFSPQEGYSGKGRDDWQSIELLKLVRKLQPQIIVNDRLDLMDVNSGWDFRTPEQFMPRDQVTVNGEKVPWETCQTFSGSWGYYRDQYSWKSIRQLLMMLIETVSKGGNLLLNVGPTARGNFDFRADNCLEGISNWMQLHNRSIYGCTQAPKSFNPPKNCLLTYNENTHRMYVHILEWPFKSLYLDGFAGKVKYAQLLHDASEIKMKKNTKGAWMANETNNKQETLILEIPISKPNVEIPVIELILK